MKNNVEIDVLIQTTPTEEIVSDVYATYNSLKYLPGCIVPDEEFISLYEKMCDVRKRHERTITQDSRYHRMVLRFQEKASRLPPPPLTIRDLHGWQRLVYEKLPDESFRTHDIYQFVEEFQRYYPENRNIKPKIRQVLQQLRDLKIIRHVERETWVKEKVGE